MGRRLKVAVLLALLGWIITPVTVVAGSCGGAVPCQCGDTVTADSLLSQDLGPCPGHGLAVKSNVRLDCQGFRIAGLGNGSEQYGIYLRGEVGAEVTGVTVERCEVTGFHHGIRLRAASGNTLLENFAHGNGNFSTHVGYGIDLALESKNNTLQRNTVQGNADEGVHIGTGGHGNRLVDNVLTGNYREDLYSLAADGGVFLGNVVGGPGTGSNSLYLKDSSSSYLEGNTFRSKTARITGDSRDSQLISNTFAGAGLHVRYYAASPSRYPVNTRVTGSAITGAGNCLRFTRSLGSVVTDTLLSDCGTEILSESGAGEPSDTTVVSVPLNPSKVSLDANSTLSTGWWATVLVEETSGAPVAGARVQTLDAAGTLVADLLTDGEGYLPPQVLLESVRTGSTTSALTPHTLTATKAGYLSASRVVQATADATVTLVLVSAGGSGQSFADAFNRPDSSTLGNGWEEVRGDLRVSGGELRNAALTGDHVAVLPGLSGATQSAAADFASVDNNPGPRFGVVLRFRDSRNYYLLYRQAGGTSFLRISKVVNGVETILAAAPITNPPLNSFFRLGGRATGTTLTLELNGVMRLSVLDPTFVDGTLGILLGSKSTKPNRADNFSATVQ